jgi:hypothetical protein
MEVFPNMLSAYGSEFYRDPKTGKETNRLIYYSAPMVYRRKLAIGEDGVVSLENIEKVIFDKMTDNPITRMFTIDVLRQNGKDLEYVSMISKVLTGKYKDVSAVGRAHCQEGQNQKRYLIRQYQDEKYMDSEGFEYKSRYVK